MAKDREETLQDFTMWVLCVFLLGAIFSFARLPKVDVRTFGSSDSLLHPYIHISGIASLNLQAI